MRATKEDIRKVQDQIGRVDMEIAAHLTGSIQQLVTAEQKRGERAAAETLVASMVAVFNAAPEDAQMGFMYTINRYVDVLLQEERHEAHSRSSGIPYRDRKRLSKDMTPFFKTGTFPDESEQ